jgi:hypothetical protein
MNDVSEQNDDEVFSQYAEEEVEQSDFIQTLEKIRKDKTEDK